MNKINRSTFLGLPCQALTILSGGIAFFFACLGISLMDKNDIALQVANAQLVTSSSADRLELLADKLEKQAEIIQQKDEAYIQLETIYKGYLAHEKGEIELGEAFSVMQELPEVGNTEEIQQEISEVEKDLSEITSE